MQSREVRLLGGAPLPDVRLRPATDADAPGVAACVEGAYRKWIARLGRKPWPMLQDYAEVIANETVVVAATGRDVVGVLVLSTTPEGFLVENVAVVPHRAGTGIGRLLLSHAEREAMARGHASLYLYTNEKMTENIALYSKAGYVEYERRQEDGFRRVFMRKPLV